MAKKKLSDEKQLEQLDRTTAKLKGKFVPPKRHEGSFPKWFVGFLRQKHEEIFVPGKGISNHKVHDLVSNEVPYGFIPDDKKAVKTWLYTRERQVLQKEYLIIAYGKDNWYSVKPEEATTEQLDLYQKQTIDRGITDIRAAEKRYLSICKLRGLTPNTATFDIAIKALQQKIA